MHPHLPLFSRLDSRKSRIRAAVGAGKAFFFIAVYFLGIWIGFACRIYPEGSAAIRPAGGIALAAVILGGYRYHLLITGMIFVLNVLGNIAGGFSVPAGFGLAVVNTLETYCAYRIFYIFCRDSVSFGRLKEILILLGAAVGVNTLTAFAGAAVSAVASGIPFFRCYYLWFIADGLGILIITPVVVSIYQFRQAGRLRLNPKTSGRWLFYTVLLIGLTLEICGRGTGAPWLTVRSYLVFPMIIMAAVSLEPYLVGSVFFFLTGAVLLSVSKGSMSGPHIFITYGRAVVLHPYLIIMTVTGYLLSAVMTERRKTVTDLQEIDERFRQLTENIQIAFWIVSPDWNVVHYVSRAYETIWGRSVESLYAKPDGWFDAVIEADRRSVREVINGMVRKGDWEAFELPEYRITTPAGELRWISASAYPVRDRSGKIVRAAGFAADITDRKRIEDSLLESEIRYRELFENINSGVAVYQAVDDGRDFVFRDFNRAGEKIDNDDRERLIGRSIFEVRPGIGEFGLVEVLRDVWRTGVPRFHPITLYHDNRLTKWYENFVYKLPTREIVAVFSDITDRMRNEEMLKTALNEKETLLRELYHRTKNNMQVICSMLMLQAGHFKNRKMHDVFLEMENRIKSMSLVHQMLYESRNLSSIDLGHYISDLVSLLIASYRFEPGKIDVRFDLESVSVSIDTAIPCGLVLNELISNSLKYAFPGERKGTICIGLKKRDGGKIEITVADDGVGMSGEIHAEESESLGLQLIDGLVRHQLLGTISFTNRTGTTCTITIPASSTDRRH